MQEKRSRLRALRGELEEARSDELKLPVKMHALMHVDNLYVSAWDAISAYDFACIDWGACDLARM